MLCLAALSLPGASASAAELASVNGALAPVLSVSDETVQWNALGGETAYVIAVSNAPRGSSERSTRYLLIPRQAGEAQSFSPTLEAGQTVYVGVSADAGMTWPAEEATVTAPSSSKPPAPVLGVSGTTVYWIPVPGVTRYTFATILHPTTTRETTYTVVTGTSYTPPAVPGQTVNYGMSSTVPGTAPWAQEVSITYPSTSPGGTSEPPAPSEPPAQTEPPTSSEPPPPSEPPTSTEPPSSEPPPPSEPPSPAGRIIGTNDGAGWGEAAAKAILAGHIEWNRVEIGAPYNTVPKSLSYGFKVLAIAGNVADGTPLSQVSPSQWAAEVVSQLLFNPGVRIAEAGNEMYYKGGIANPVQYGRMYLAAVNAVKAAGIHTPLLFNMWGDYPQGSWSSPTGWSQDANGGGWLRDAVAGVPGLASAILANGVSTHPYGALSEDIADEEGVKAVAAQEAVAQKVLGAIPRFYITEFGFDMSRCGASDGACSQLDQAAKMHAAYEAFLADPHVAGIWWYQSHDDNTGQFGFMNDDNSLRPSFYALSAIARTQSSLGSEPLPAAEPPPATEPPAPTEPPLAAEPPSGSESPGSTEPSSGSEPPSTATVRLPYDPASAWNEPIGSSPVIDPLSGTYMNAIADNGLPLTSDPDEYTIPVYMWNTSTPTFTVTGEGYFHSYDAGDDISSVGHGSPWAVSGVPIPAGATAGVGSDGQIVLLNPETGVEYEFWQFYRASDGTYHATNGEESHITTGYYGRFGDGFSGRGDGTPYLAGLVRRWEIDQGHIDHAIAFAYDAPSAAFSYPASKSDGGNFGGVLGIDLPEGSRIQLDPSLTEADFEKWGLSPMARMIARALQKYGMIVVDHSGSSKIYLEDRTTAKWDSSVTRSLVSAIPWSAFRVVDTPPGPA